MKKILLALSAIAIGTAAASAADLPARTYTAPLLPPPPVFSWTGFYAGANIGGAWTNNRWTDTVLLTNFNNNNNNVGVVIPAGTIVVNNNNSWITTVAARFGWAVDHWLFYGKAGGGWVGNNNFTLTNLTTGASITCGSFSSLTNCGNNTGGWLLGAGFEYAFTNNWTVKVEYDYLGLGNRTFFIPATAPILAGDTFTSGNRNVQMVKVGFNYLFNWGAPGRY